MTKTIIVGSDAWTSGKGHRDEYAVRIVQFLKYTRKQRLCEYASSLRDGMPCTVAAKFSVGRFNMVRKLRFEDGVEWVARMRMPPIWGDDEPSLDVAMSSELATMAFVRENTEIKVPQVYGFDLDIDNGVGCPFVLMEYIPGSTAEEVCRCHYGGQEGIPAPYREKFWRQMADVMARLAAVRLPKIWVPLSRGQQPGCFRRRSHD
ncbi:hypothetical protein PWT90_10466 [Aphanocladium album]|nr:hypothetical protein PWT90_10466 [Aphanocladium album]